MQGRRIPDGTGPIRPGEYGKWSEHDGVAAWIVMAPDHCVFVLCHPNFRDKNGNYHKVQEHEDGTITCDPSGGNPNSILSPKGWHGFIRRGVWESV